MKEPEQRREQAGHSGRYYGEMIWIYARAKERLSYEVRRASSDGYEIAVTYPDGRMHLVQASDADDLARRSAEIERALKEEGWTRV